MHALERRLIHRDALDRRRRRLGGIQLARQVTLRRLQFGEQRRGDRQEIATRQFGDFAHVAEAGAHHFGRMAEFLVVGIDLRHRQHARVFLRRVGSATGVLLVPVKNATNEGRDQRHAGLGAGHRLMQPEKQRQVAMDTFFFQHRRGLNTFPGRGDLDQDAFPRNTGGFVLGDQFAPLGDGRLGIERQARIDFGGHPPGNDLEDFEPEGHRQPVEGQRNHLCRRRAGAAIAPRLGQRVVDDGLVLRHLRRRGNQRRIGRGIARRKGFDRPDIAGIGHHHGHLLELFQQTSRHFPLLLPVG